MMGYIEEAEEVARGTSGPSAITPGELKNWQKEGYGIHSGDTIIRDDTKRSIPLSKIVLIGVSVYIGYLLYQNFFGGSTGGVSISKSSSLLPMIGYTPKMASRVVQRLSDVRGVDEITEEITNLINMIKSPEKYTSKGAKVPKGLLLYGKPGTGKTMLARAIAGEAGVTFFYCTGSEFDEMFVGVGARRIRELFAQAKRHKPCIIFIDEIDTLFSYLGNMRHPP